jgi:hypothetical protein
VFTQRSRIHVCLAATVASVLLALGTAGAAASPPLTTGAGAGVGVFAYSPPIPFVSPACVTTSWTNGGGGIDAAVMVSIQGAAYAGTASDSLTATGCDTLQSGAGSATLSIGGTNPLGAQLSCGFPTGYYGRVGPIVLMTFTGTCTIDNIVSSGVTINSTGVWTPLPITLSGVVSVALTQSWQIVP